MMKLQFFPLVDFLSIETDEIYTVGRKYLLRTIVLNRIESMFVSFLKLDLLVRAVVVLLVICFLCLFIAYFSIFFYIF
jgi:hypothetical protein